ncbi:ABC transporter substrate-binding protein [uncultured Brachyspira sp.]|uniref:ABC transporter substrate-binding protein n=1 Tax=uncultured Brachyspira sp. TaxID=221953 RepID=UPI00262B273A|nr:ABC transporter substrate-binding protein [uncultured Brachyspira sp.]
MKKLLISFFIVMLLIVSCSNKNTENSKTATDTAASDTDKVLKIGVLQLVEHSALDQANKGFIDGLAEAGYIKGENIDIDYQNAQGDQANCVTIAQKFVNDRVDLILAIATPAAQAVANLAKDIPVLITAVTDPADSKLVADNSFPGGNVTGTSDLTPVEEQMELLRKLLPSAKKVAFLYSSSEANSKFQIDIAKKKADEMGLLYVDATITNPNDIQQVVQSLVGKVDVIYVPTDNMVSAGMANVIAISSPAKIPVICGEAAMLDAGGLATYGIDYYELGRLTAGQAVKILSGQSSPANMPIEYMKNPVLSINTNAAQELGVLIPAGL